MHSYKKSDIDSVIRFALNILHTHETIVAPLRHDRIQNAKSGIESLDRALLDPQLDAESKAYIREQRAIHEHDIARLMVL